jgi:5-(carboxyamino)imidazole ribonucleotide mutase
MGSDSDLPVISQAADTLAAFDVACHMRILSAHRVPQMVAELAGQAREQGYQVIIAAAGMAAHLPGVIAAYTTLPVIGVPLASKVLDGQDALYSIVQMPPGVPVATVGIGAAKNAALLALQIIGVGDERVAVALQAEKERMAQAVLEKDARLQSLGHQAYSQKQGDEMR